MRKTNAKGLVALFLTALALFGYHEAGFLLDPLEQMIGPGHVRSDSVRPDWAFLVELGAILSVGFFLAFFHPFLTPRVGLLMVVLVSCALGGAAFSLSSDFGVLKFGYPFVLLVVGYLSSLLLKDRPSASPETVVEVPDGIPQEPAVSAVSETIPELEQATPVSAEQSSGAVEPVEAATVSSAEPAPRATEESPQEAEVPVPVPDEIGTIGEILPVEPKPKAPTADGHAETQPLTKLGSFDLELNPVPGPFGLRYRGKDAAGRHASVYTIPLALIPVHERDAFRKRMLMHAETLGRLSHPGIARVLESGETAETAFIAYEAVEGALLSEYCEKGSLMSLSDALGLIAKIAEVIDVAHKNGLIHRALRPGTIVLRPDGGVVIVEFGLAEIAGGGGDSLPVEILPYTAPEVVFSRKADGRADMFSLGAIFFEMLAGERLFGGDVRADIFYQITTKPHRRISDARPDLPDFCDLLLDRLAAKTREQRYQLSVDLADDVAMLLFNL